MKILMATMQLDIGGAETHIVELSKALSRMGVEILVASNGGAYEEELKQAGIRHFKIPMHNKSVGGMMQAYRSLKKLILEEKVDVVHAHARIPAFLCGLLRKKIPFRFVTTAHWVFNARFPFNILTNWGDRTLAVSDDIKNYLVEKYGVHAEDIRVTINGIDTEKFSAQTDYSAVAKEFGLTEDKTRIVYVSRMDIDRSFAAHKLIEVAEELDKQIPNLEIVIVGGGNDFETIQTEAEQVNRAVGRGMILLTNSRTDINRFIASGDIFIGVSRAALEAMACEKPCIIAGNEGYIGIFDEDKLKVSIDTNFCCRGCAQTTAVQLQKDILYLLKEIDGSERDRLGQFARQTVKEHYSVETMAGDALKMYLSMIKYKKINETELTEVQGIEKYLAVPFGEKKKQIDVMISGYYGFRNSGDESILRAMVDSLRRERPDIRILVLSRNPKETRRVYGTEAINRFNFLKLLHLLRRTKLLISGGGSLIQDVTSNQSLVYYLSIIKAAKKRGAKVMLYANGIGPVNNLKNYKMVSKTLNQVDLITLREESSLEELHRLGVTVPPSVVTADPAFVIPCASEAHIAEVMRRVGLPEEKKYFCIAVRPWSKLDKNFDRILAELTEYVTQKYELVPVFIPMQPLYDKEISNRILRKCKGGGLMFKDVYSSSILLGVTKGAEFILAMRLHTLIYAAGAGTPVIGLAYDPKVNAMMEYMGQKYMMDVSNMDLNVLKKYVDEILENKAEISRQLSAISAESKEKAEQNTAYVLQLIDGK